MLRSAVAQERERLLGVWKLEAFEIEFQDTGERTPPFGAHPNGYIIFTAEGRMMALLTAAGRQVPQTDAECAAALRSMYAYSGTYRLEGDRWLTKVDTAWNEAWTGTDQLRFYRFDGEKLVVTTPWGTPVGFEGRQTRGILTWVKER
jgi:hypothetical protein